MAKPAQTAQWSNG